MSILFGPIVEYPPPPPECVVCLKALSGKVYEPPHNLCQHKMHAECAAEWAKSAYVEWRTPQCPACRGPIQLELFPVPEDIEELRAEHVRKQEAEEDRLARDYEIQQRQQALAAEADAEMQDHLQEVREEMSEMSDDGDGPVFTCIAVNRVKNWVVVLRVDGMECIAYDGETHNIVWNRRMNGRIRLNGFACVEDEDEIVCGMIPYDDPQSQPAVSVYNFRENRFKRQLHTFLTGGWSDIVSTHDGKRVVVSDETFSVKLFDAMVGSEYRLIRIIDMSPRATGSGATRIKRLSITPDEHRIIATTDSLTVVVRALFVPCSSVDITYQHVLSDSIGSSVDSNNAYVVVSSGNGGFREGTVSVFKLDTGELVFSAPLCGAAVISPISNAVAVLNCYTTRGKFVRDCTLGGPLLDIVAAHLHEPFPLFMSDGRTLVAVHAYGCSRIAV